MLLVHLQNFAYFKDDAEAILSISSARTKREPADIKISHISGS